MFCNDMCCIVYIWNAFSIEHVPVFCNSLARISSFPSKSLAMVNDVENLFAKRKISQITLRENNSEDTDIIIKSISLLLIKSSRRRWLTIMFGRWWIQTDIECCWQVVKSTSKHSLCPYLTKVMQNSIKSINYGTKYSIPNLCVHKIYHYYWAPYNYNCTSIIFYSWKKFMPFILSYTNFHDLSNWFYEWFYF